MRKSGDISEGKHKQPNAQTAHYSEHAVKVFTCFIFQSIRILASSLQQWRTFSVHQRGAARIKRWAVLSLSSFFFCRLLCCTYFSPFNALSKYVSMTQLLTHTIAHSTRPSFSPQNNNQPTKKFLILAVSCKEICKTCNVCSFSWLILQCLAF